MLFLPHKNSDSTNQADVLPSRNRYVSSLLVLCRIALCPLIGFGYGVVLTPRAFAQHSATATWQQPTQPVGESVSYTSLYRDGKKLASPIAPTVLTYIDTSVNAGETHTYYATNTDASARESIPSNAVTVVIPGGVTPPPTFTPVRIKPGSAYTDSQGNAWASDASYCPAGNTYSTTHVITGALPSSADGALYQTERYDNPTTVTCTIPAPAGTYTATAKFAEIYFATAGSRIFNVTINGASVLSNFDIFAAAGGEYKAIDKSFTFTTTGSPIVISFVSTVQNAKYDALQVVQTGTPPPPPPPITLTCVNNICTINGGVSGQTGQIQIIPGGPTASWTKP
jgi:Malectin domain